MLAVLCYAIVGYAMLHHPRAAMLLEFDAAVGVHFDHMAREDFRKTIDSNWNWLDGRSLI